MGEADSKQSLFLVHGPSILRRRTGTKCAEPMTFILAADGRDDDVSNAFERYKAYLEASKNRFPPSAYELATSDWYFNFKDHRSPHDAWIEEVSLTEFASVERPRERELSLTVRLLGAYHDGLIELRYPRVLAYSMAVHASSHRDWRYDELRVSDDGHLVHEIEWRGLHQTGHWLIEATDLEFRWLPKSET